MQRGPRRLFDSRRNGDAEPEEKDVGDRELKLEQQFAMPSNKLDDKVPLPKPPHLTPSLLALPALLTPSASLLLRRPPRRRCVSP